MSGRAFSAAALAERISSSIRAARQGRSGLAADALMVEGLSSAGVRHLLNNLCRGPGVNYLEIGTYKGSSIVAASYDNPGRFTAVDNFAEFDHMSPRASFQSVRAHFADHCRFTFLEADCWSAALRRRLPRQVNVYFYDGPHSFDDQYRAFTHFDPVFASTFLAVVDDWNSPKVRKATQQAFADLGYRVLHARELFTRNWIRDHWWNGLLLAVLRKKRARAAAPARAGTGARRPGPAAPARSRGRRPAPPAPPPAPRRRRAARAGSR